MNRIRSLDELGRFLDGELAWRKRELTTLKFMLDNPRRHERDLLLRSAVCILYAHWEGFVRAAAIGYASFVATRDLRYADLTPNFVALGLRQEIVEAGRSGRASTHIDLTRKLMGNLRERPKIDWEHCVDTRANLNSDALSEIVCQLGLEGRVYLTKRQLLDQKLIANRNVVAHGGRLSIEAEDYALVHEEVIDLALQFRNDVENAAVGGEYRRRGDQ